MDRNEYVVEVTTKLTNLFKASKAGYKLPDIERHRLEGFIQAGVFLKLVTKIEMSGLMDSVHFSVFGKTIAERKTQKRVAWPEITIDYDSYDSPTFER